MKRFHASALLLLAALIAIGLPAAAQADSIINIHFEGLNFHYVDPGLNQDGDIYDSASGGDNSLRPGSYDSGLATPLTALSIFQDQGSTPVATVSVSRADMHIGGIPDIAAGSSVTYATSSAAKGFGVDLLDATAGQHILQLNFDNFKVSYLDFGVASIVAAGGTIDPPVVSQDLPNGLVIDGSKPITFSLTSAALSNVNVVGGRVVSFDAFGTGDIKATLVPEPAALVSLAAMALCGLAYALRRRAA